MDSTRYTEEGFNNFLGTLLKEKKQDEQESAAIKLVIAMGYKSLTNNQKLLLEKAIYPFVQEECMRCGHDIPWSEMLATEDNGGMCNWCEQHFHQNYISYRLS